MIPLFKQFPGLQGKLPHVSMGLFPTPVLKLEKLGEKLGLGRLYLKHDGLSGEKYGGNKVRKLEFLLGEAQKDRCREVMTYGFAGSNHATATAVFARKLGMRSISMLMPQPNAHIVGKNLLMSFASGAELHLYPSHSFLGLGTICESVRHFLKTGKFPMVIVPGGSSPLGCCGFVNAAFELKEQVYEGLLPEPDLIYCALGTAGTAAGLVLGLKAAGMKTRVQGVQVTEEAYSGEKVFIDLLKKTNRLLHSMDPAFPVLDITPQDFDIRREFFGEAYGLFTEEGINAIKALKENEGIKLEGTYTGKTFAAVMADAPLKESCDKVILFWDTYNAVDYAPVIDKIDYHDLPKQFHRYFEEEYQELDRH